MGTIKVTFYNNNTLGEGNIQSDSSGIYFQPSGMMSSPFNLPAHIVHNGHFYTYGSYVINDDDNTPVNYDSAYVVTDITANQYAKTLTVRKQKLNLSELKTKIDNYASYFDELCASEASLQLGNEYNINISINNHKLQLSSASRKNPSCSIKLNNGEWTDSTITYNLSTSPATITIGQIDNGAKINSVTVSSTSHNFSESTTTRLSELFEVNNNTIRIKPNVGWLDTLATSYSFDINVQLGAQDGITNINTVNKKFTCKLNKKQAKYTPATTDLILSKSKQVIYTNTILKDIEPENATVTYNVNLQGKLMIANGGKEVRFATNISPYSFNTGTTDFQLSYIITTGDKDIYYNYRGIINGKIQASEWTVNFNSRGTTVKTSTGYYTNSVAFPTNPSNYTENDYTYTFVGWKDNNGNIYTTNSNLTFGKEGVNFGTSYTLTLTASFNATQNTQYYWYIGSMTEADALNTTTLGNIVNGKNATSSTTGISTLNVPNDAANEVIVFVYPEIWGRPTIKSENGFGTGDGYFKDEGFETPAGYNVSFWPGDQAIKGKTLKITWSK